MFIATLFNTPDDYRLLAIDSGLPRCLRSANAMIAEDPALLRRLERGGILIVEHYATCGTYDQIKVVAGRRAQEIYDRTRAADDHAYRAGGSGDQSPAGPPASGDSGDAKGT